MRLYVYTLNITNVDLSHLGSYEVVITVDGKRKSDVVELMLPGEPIMHVTKILHGTTI